MMYALREPQNLNSDFPFDIWGLYILLLEIKVHPGINLTCLRYLNAIFKPHNIGVIRIVLNEREGIKDVFDPHILNGVVPLW